MTNNERSARGRATKTCTADAGLVADARHAYVQCLTMAVKGSTTHANGGAESAAPLARMAHTAVSLRNGRSSSRNSKGTTSVAISNWDEHKAHSVDRWASALEPNELLESESERQGRNRAMRFGIGRYSASVGEGHRENYGVKKGRDETAALEHPNLSLWSPNVSTANSGRERAQSVQDNGCTNTELNPPPRGLPDSIPSRFANSLSSASQRRDISKSSSTRSSMPVIVVPYTAHPPPPSAPPSNASHASRFSFSSISAPRIPKSIYKMRSSGPPPSLPPVSEFDIQNILEWAKADDVQTGECGVAADLERIAEICARSRLSLSNQYERHMPPHGVGHEFSTVDVVPAPGPAQRRAKKGKSRAFETLETIYASSSSGRSSKDGKGRKKSAMELAEEVRARNVKDGKKAEEEIAQKEGEEDADHERSVIEGAGGRDHHVRREGLIVGSRHAHVGRDGKRQKRLAAVVIDTASSDGSKEGRRLTSKPLKPTESRVEMGVGTVVEAIAVHEQMHNTEIVSQHQPHVPLVAPEMPLATIPIPHDDQPQQSAAPSQSALGTFSTWLPWLRQPMASVEAIPAEVVTETYFEVLPSAEGSLKRLLDASEKGKRRSGEGCREAR